MNPAETFVAKLRAISRSPENPDGIKAHVIAAALGCSLDSVRRWRYGTRKPAAFAVESLLEKISKLK